MYVTGIGGPSFYPQSPLSRLAEAKTIAINLEDHLIAFIENLGREGEMFALQDKINMQVSSLTNLYQNQKTFFNPEQQKAMDIVIKQLALFKGTDAGLITPEQLTPALESVKDLIQTF